MNLTMRVQVRFFASLREIVGSSADTLQLAEGSTVEQAWVTLAAAHPALAPRREHVAAALDRRYVPFDAILTDGCELVFIPPVSGG